MWYWYIGARQINDSTDIELHYNDRRDEYIDVRDAEKDSK